MKTFLKLTLGLCLIAGQGLAENIALVMTNARYEALSNIRLAGQSHQDMVRAYEAAGYTVMGGANLDRRAMADELDAFEAGLGDADQVIIHVTGHLALGDQIYLLPVESAAQTRTGLSETALPLSLILELLSEKPGRAALFLGAVGDAREGFEVDPTALPEALIPQGVARLSGAPQPVFRLARRLLEDGRSLADAGGLVRSVQSAGFLSPNLQLGAAAEPPSDPVPVTSLVERTLWSLAEQNPTEENLAAYLRRFPEGQFAEAARAELEALEAA